MRQITIATTLVWLAISATANARETQEPIPETKQVKAISIKFDHPQKDDVQFTATLEDWKAIRATLLPAKRDAKPAEWEWLGTVKLVTKDNQPFRIELYHTSGKGPGAFAAGKTYKQRVYYRGGKTTALAKAVNAAYEKSQKKDK